MRSKFATWWASARSTVAEATWEARFWMVVGIAGLGWRPLRESIPVLFFMSAWANVKSNRTEAQAAKREMLEEEAEVDAHGEQSDP